MAQIIPLDRHRRQRGHPSRIESAQAALHEPRASSPHLREAKPVRDVGSATLPVSVVVPTCGRPLLLDRCLAALCAQRFSPQRYEILIVDDRPSEATRNLVECWERRMAESGPRIVYLANEGVHGPAAARNRGWRAARGSIIAFTDDDTVPDAGWLQGGMRAFADDVQAVWGRIVMPLAGTPSDYERDAKGLERAEFVTANCFCPRYVLEELEGFDERFQSAWREDADLYFRLLKREGRVVHAPAAVVVHPVRPARWGVSLMQQKKIVFDALLYKKHPMLYREKIRANARWDYYLTVILLVTAVLAAWQDLRPLAVVAAAGWVLSTGHFCLRRLANTRKDPLHVAEMIVTSALIPPAAVFWRAVGALRFRAPLF